jgi:TPR repeat protein
MRGIHQVKRVILLVCLMVLCGVPQVIGVSIFDDYNDFNIKELTSMAEEGDTFFMLILGDKYYQGEDVPQDYKQAVKWYAKAAEQGDATAQHRLGMMYSLSYGVPEDFVYSYVWNSLAAASGNESAIKNRDAVAKLLSAQQLAEAQEIARKKYAEIEARKNK